MILQNSGLICHLKFELLQHYYVSKDNLKLNCFRSLSFPRFLTNKHQWPPGDDSIMFYDFWFVYYDLDGVA